MSKYYAKIENERGVCKSQIAEDLLDIELYHSPTGDKKDSKMFTRVQIMEELKGMVCIRVDGILIKVYETEKGDSKWKMTSTSL